MGVRVTVWLEVPPEAEEDGQFQEAQVEVPHGAAGEDGACRHLCSGVFSGESEAPLDFIGSHSENKVYNNMSFRMHHRYLDNFLI